MALKMPAQNPLMLLVLLMLMLRNVFTSLFEILKLKFGEILNLIFYQDIEAEEELNPPIRCAFGNVYFHSCG